jgi:hypothetical protein
LPGRIDRRDQIGKDAVEVGHGDASGGRDGREPSSTIRVWQRP